MPVKAIDIPELVERRDIMFDAAASCPESMTWGKAWLTEQANRLNDMVRLASYSLAKEIAG